MKKLTNEELNHQKQRAEFTVMNNSMNALTPENHCAFLVYGLTRVLSYAPLVKFAVYSFACFLALSVAVSLKDN